MKGMYRVSEISDREAWKALKGNDIGALKILYERHYNTLFQYAKSYCGHSEMAEDHIQNLFLKIWENRNSIGYVTAVKTYMWTALRRSLINTLKKNERETIESKEKVENYTEMSFNVEEIIIREEAIEEKKQRINQLFDQLPSRQKEILFLKFYEGMNYEEIEQIMSISSQTVRNYVYNGLKKLRKAMADYDNDEQDITIQQK